MIAIIVYKQTNEQWYSHSQLGQNRSRNVTVRVLAGKQTHRQTDRQTGRQTQTDFIICPMLYAIAMGQIKTTQTCALQVETCTNIKKCYCVTRR